MRYPQYSRVQPNGQLVLAGIMIWYDLVSALHATQGMAFAIKPLPPLLVVENGLFSKLYSTPRIDPRAVTEVREVFRTGVLWRQRKLVPPEGPLLGAYEYYQLLAEYPT